MPVVVLVLDDLRARATRAAAPRRVAMEIAKKNVLFIPILFGVNSISLHERIKVAPLDVDLPPTLDVLDASIYDAIFVKCLS